MRIIDTPKVYLIARPAIAKKGFEAFLKDQKLKWPTPTKGVKAAERIVEIAGRCCFDDKTEILTGDGWKLFSDLMQEDMVATLNPVSLALEFEKPLAYHEYNYNGNLKSVEGKNISLAVTPEHRQWGRFNKANGELGFTETQDIGNRQFRVKIGGSRWRGETPGFIKIPGMIRKQQQSNQFGSYGSRTVTTESRVYSKESVNALAQLMTYYITEGSASSVRGIDIYGNHKRDVEKLCNILGLTLACGTDPRNGVKRLHVGGGQALKNFMISECSHGSANKHFPNWVMSLPSRQLQNIWTILVKTDGHEYENGREVLITTSTLLADQAQEILCKLGFSSSCNYESAGINHKVWRITKKTTQDAILNRHTKIVDTPYQGMVYCVTTKNGVVLVRRDKKPHFSGNCYMSFGNKAGSKTNRRYIQNLLGRNDDGSFKPGPAHGSVCEHPNWTFIIVGCGRGWSHEQVRHRVGVAYSQLSTRYCDFEREEEEGTWDPGFCIPPLANLSKPTRKMLEVKLKESQKAYVSLLHNIEADLSKNKKFAAQLVKVSEREAKRMLRKAARGAARDILPIATEAIMTMTMNARVIWNTIVLRANEHAEAVIRDVYVQISRIMEEEMPALFNNMKYVKVWDGSEAVIMPREKL